MYHHYHHSTHTLKHGLNTSAQATFLYIAQISERSFQVMNTLTRIDGFTCSLGCARRGQKLGKRILFFVGHRGISQDHSWLFARRHRTIYIKYLVYWTVYHERQVNGMLKTGKEGDR